MIANIARFERAFVKFDAANAADPNQDVFEGVAYPKELLYAKRMTTMLKHFEPDASETLQLAARCQHICRWQISRNSYPMDRIGYKCWRMELYKFHSEITGEIMREVGYDEEMIANVQALLRKERLKTNPESQSLEDVVGLVFLQYYLVDFVNKYSYFEEEKLFNILRKTWKKMSEKGHITALKFNFTPELRVVLNKVLAVA
ncbi:conserved hypothetical protein [Candidatus Nitrotoga sp. HW29]|uniref:DUF4202 domain-containing protein n=1 Tax=Candidatus Nitrotoga sp. HW29 TaxID=2886963 RepID=UPI001EF2A942|nr:DUF4202 domain-containing protein [Candidatus Nitrotoga sp. HW29]CAH1904722.1 conserved hypothetical protein [Candidatus Nitrotoga sp. HW29]